MNFCITKKCRICGHEENIFEFAENNQDSLNRNFGVKGWKKFIKKAKKEKRTLVETTVSYNYYLKCLGKEGEEKCLE